MVSSRVFLGGKGMDFKGVLVKGDLFSGLDDVKGDLFSGLDDVWNPLVFDFVPGFLNATLFQLLPDKVS